MAIESSPSSPRRPPATTRAGITSYGAINTERNRGGDSDHRNEDRDREAEAAPLTSTGRSAAAAEMREHGQGGRGREEALPLLGEDLCAAEEGTRNDAVDVEGVGLDGVGLDGDGNDDRGGDHSTVAVSTSSDSAASSAFFSGRSQLDATSAGGGIGAIMVRAVAAACVVAAGAALLLSRGDGWRRHQQPYSPSSASYLTPVLGSDGEVEGEGEGGAGGVLEDTAAAAATARSSSPPRRPPPFPAVDRSDYGTPASRIVDPDLFHPSLRPPPPSDSDDSDSRARAPRPLLNVPFPTGAFWTNLVLAPTADRGLSFPIMCYPYGYKWSADPAVGLQVSYPPLRRLVDDISIRDIFNPDLTLTSVEAEDGGRLGTRREIVKFDELSVTLRFYAAADGDGGGGDGGDADVVAAGDGDGNDEDGGIGGGGGGGEGGQRYWETHLVQGSPYVTATYHRTAPVLTPLSIFERIACPPRDVVSAGDDGGYDEGGEGVCRDVGGREATPRRDGTTVLRGVRFVIQTRENQYWLVFASKPITLSFDNISKRTIRSTSSEYSGTIRLALIPPPFSWEEDVIRPGSPFPDRYDSPLDRDPSASPASNMSGMRRLIRHANVYPVGGRVSWRFRPSTNVRPFSPSSERKDNEDVDYGVFGFLPSVRVATVTFEYETRHWTANDGSNGDDGSDELLMLALPHHADVLQDDIMLTDASMFDLTYRCIKGPMTPVVGATWSYDEPLTDVGFDDLPSLRNAASLDDETRRVILDQIREDKTRVLPTLTENVYGFGKQIARLAQLTHIASVVTTVTSSGVVEGDGSWSLADEYAFLTEDTVRLLHSYLSSFLRDETTRDRLLYDVNFGGIVTKDGLVNSEGDFGNGWYNDHLFHYGYILYACAIMGKLNSTFVSEYGSSVDALLYDVASDSDGGNGVDDDNDEFAFPLARHKLWYDGHSYASGLFPFADGKSQESSSEAVNCYFGAYLWSSVRWGNRDDRDGNAMDTRGRTDFARLLLAMEIRGAKTYWHMVPSDEEVANVFHRTSIYPMSFAENYMVGNLGMTDVTVATWFGTKQLYVHMINFLPITAITKDLFDRSYVEKEFTNIIEPIYPDVEMAWRGYTICDRAILDPKAAWEDALELRSYELDQAISQSEVLYWISTMNGFATADTASRPMRPTMKPGTDANSQTTTVAPPPSSCSDYKACAALGLTGNCCPTADGTYLGCCEHTSDSSHEDERGDPDDSKSTNKQGSDSSTSSCADNASCSALGLTGLCCPTPEGVMLGCCA